MAFEGEFGCTNDALRTVRISFFGGFAPRCAQHFLLRCWVALSWVRSTLAVDVCDTSLQLESRWFRLRVQPHAAAVAEWRVDSLGGGRLGPNTILGSDSSTSQATAVRWCVPVQGQLECRTAEGVAWRVQAVDEHTLEFCAAERAPAFEWVFDMATNHATVLGWMDPGQRRVRLPCVMHWPDLGSARLTCSHDDIRLDYDASRRARPRYVRVRFPPAPPGASAVVYRLEVTCLHPTWVSAADGPLYDGVRRSFLNIFQVNPRFQMLANNSASDPVTFILYQYADMAAELPPLVEGLTAMDLIRMTLDQYARGRRGYGQVGYGPVDGDEEIAPWATPWTTTDSYPSLVIAAARYVESTGDLAWLKERWPTIFSWAREMVARDEDQDGLIEYPATGNYGDRPRRDKRPSNWWDTINFGHEDAYSNALIYRAARAFARLAQRLGHRDVAAEFDAHADRLHAAYVPGFLNPETGILAGWRSADGQLHDYWFTFVNGAAISYDLVPEPLAHQILDRFMAKFHEVGYTNFALGLPGNLVPIRKGDYVHHNTPPERFGEPQLEDGSDGFQFYENGGATACFAYFFIHALYRLGRVEEARRILHPMLQSFARGDFQGFDESGRSRDWKNWRGGGHGYEGFLADSYYTLLAAKDDLEVGRGSSVKTSTHRTGGAR